MRVSRAKIASIDSERAGGAPIVNLFRCSCSCFSDAITIDSNNEREHEDEYERE